ncbi:unnamed protein product [Penicillium olsonii]|uniref:Mitochondrial ATP synthase epsilon chain domain-containing protein n=1 Tax=Penicillium olsonii TaxID=99116 RepID=A0A9W4MM29_PENOL|nr:unnamed protein product [Penicillium olsonii]CAG8004554.1 unnamed protein product [Penicillium olsonii]
MESHVSANIELPNLRVECRNPYRFHPLQSNQISHPPFKMTAAWKAAGLTYNRYLAIAARTVRRSLKDGPRLASERRGQMDLRFAKWENGKQGEVRSLAQANNEALAQAAEK